MLRPASEPFRADGGMRLVTGNLGRGISRPARSTRLAGRSRRRRAASTTRTRCSTPSRPANSTAMCAVVVRFQGPRANGMPELHKLTPALGVLQDRGFKVALVTDGRMSGASGKVPAAIHLARGAARRTAGAVRDGDVIRLCAHDGTLDAVAADLAVARAGHSPPPQDGTGRELFALLRLTPTDAEARRLGDACRDGGRAHEADRVADVGGTHARFAMAQIEDGRVCRSANRTLKTADHAASGRAWRGFGRHARHRLPHELALAFAGPVGGEVLELTNNPWVIRPF